MIVKRNKANVTIICGRFFYPGVNVIKPEDEKKFEDNETFVSLLSIKINGLPIHEIVSEGESTEVVDKKSGKTVKSDLAGMNATNAVEVVKDTLDIPTLESWIDTEDRKTVLKAINAQIEVIKSGGSGSDGGDED